MDMDFVIARAQELGLFLASGFVLWLLGRAFFVTRPPGFLTRDLATDILYQIMTPLYAFVLIAMFSGVMAFVVGPEQVAERLLQGAEPMRDWPLWLQVTSLLLLRDVAQYWVHRALHQPTLWKYHAIHHAPEDLAWHHAYRFHPVNYLLYVTLVDLALYSMGYPITVMLAIVPVLGVFSLFVHSNLRWSYGPLRYVLTSPVFHRWHHSAEDAALDKNFAPNFPFIDLIFGTFYMPKGQLPQQVGIAGGDVPTRFRGQMLYPFRRAPGAKNPSNS
ncbi:MAG: sterol desaturase [Azospirillum brasilense]|nr:MAG: sterol desaturase [Azospirillum brasilense]